MSQYISELGSLPASLLKKAWFFRGQLWQLTPPVSSQGIFCIRQATGKKRFCNLNFQMYFQDIQHSFLQ